MDSRGPAGSGTGSASAASVTTGTAARSSSAVSALEAPSTSRHRLVRSNSAAGSRSASASARGPDTTVALRSTTTMSLTAASGPSAAPSRRAAAWSSDPAGRKTVVSHAFSACWACSLAAVDEFMLGLRSIGDRLATS